MVPPSRTAALGLYRQLLREGRQLMDYNYRDYAIRRARLGFVKARECSPNESEKIFAKGEEQLQILRRQAIISRLYPHQ
ncbi:unnamed protein product, partial [Choristocarpus tenellus]